MTAMVYKWFLTGLVSFFHPFFVSVTEMNHNAKDKTLEISCKLFADDFEKGLEQVYKIPVDITNPKDKKQTDQYISDYLKKHLQLKIDGKSIHNLEQYRLESPPGGFELEIVENNVLADPAGNGCTPPG